jgi:hypothetical protein
MSETFFKKDQVFEVNKSSMSVYASTYDCRNDETYYHDRKPAHLKPGTRFFVLADDPGVVEGINTMHVPILVSSGDKLFIHRANIKMGCSLVG